MDPRVEGAILGALIAGLVALTTGWLSRRHESQRSDNEWFREKLLEAYSNCIYYLVKLSISASERPAGDKEKAANRKDIRQHFSESQRYLILLRAYHSDSQSVEALKATSHHLAEHWADAEKLPDVADTAVEVVKGLLEKDSRVRPPTSNPNA
jgi:hypothetical protein